MLNPRKKSGLPICIALACACYYSVPIYADQSSPDETPQPRAALNSLGTPVLSEQVLAQQRGGTLVVNDMTLNGVVADNQAYNLNTGNNTISDGAFSGVSGIPMVIQNSGNNVLIQNATIVNVQVK